jgi:hypothetical protein
MAGIPWPMLIVFAGWGQLLLAGASLALPSVLGWREQTTHLRPLTRQVFWTYAAYIWTTNVCFGLLSILGPYCLLDGSPLAAAVTGFITLYWGARLLIQLAVFDRTDVSPGWYVRPAEAVIVLLFLYLTLVFGGVLVLNLGAGT